MKSLNVLQSHFKISLRENRSLVSEEDFKRLFSNIDKIAEATRKCVDLFSRDGVLSTSFVLETIAVILTAIFFIFLR